MINQKREREWTMPWTRWTATKVNLCHCNCCLFYVSIFLIVYCLFSCHSARLQRDRERALPSPARSSARLANARCGRREAGQGAHGGYPLPLRELRHIHPPGGAPHGPSAASATIRDAYCCMTLIYDSDSMMYCLIAR